MMARNKHPMTASQRSLLEKSPAHARAMLRMLFARVARRFVACCIHKEIIKFLIEKSEDKKLILDWKDNEKGQTALHKAAAYKRRTICQILVNAGASVSVLDECGKTARHLAQASEDHELTSYLEGQERIQLSRKDFETAV